MLSEAKHLADPRRKLAMGHIAFVEMLHFVQHDIVLRSIH